MTGSRNSGKKGSSRKALSSRASSSAKVASRKSVPSATNILEGFFPQKNNETMEKIMSQSKSQMDKIAQDASALSRESFEAFTKSSSIFTKGFEEITRTVMALAQGAAEKQTQFMNKALSSKTLNEWAEAQNKMSQASLDDMMSAAAKLAEMSVKVLTESAEPINEQLSKSVRKARESMAA